MDGFSELRTMIFLAISSSSGVAKTAKMGTLNWPVLVSAAAFYSFSYSLPLYPIITTNSTTKGCKAPPCNTARTNLTFVVIDANRNDTPVLLINLLGFEFIDHGDFFLTINKTKNDGNATVKASPYYTIEIPPINYDSKPTNSPKTGNSSPSIVVSAESIYTFLNSLPLNRFITFVTNTTTTGCANPPCNTLTINLPFATIHANRNDTPPLQITLLGFTFVDHGNFVFTFSKTGDGVFRVVSAPYITIEFHKPQTPIS